MRVSTLWQDDGSLGNTFQHAPPHTACVIVNTFGPANAITGWHVEGPAILGLQDKTTGILTGHPSGHFMNGMPFINPIAAMLDLKFGTMTDLLDTLHAVTGLPVVLTHSGGTYRLARADAPTLATLAKWRKDEMRRKNARDKLLLMEGK